MNDEVLGNYMLVGGSKCSVVIAVWLVCFADVSADVNSRTQQSRSCSNQFVKQVLYKVKRL